MSQPKRGEPAPGQFWCKELNCYLDLIAAATEKSPNRKPRWRSAIRKKRAEIRRAEREAQRAARAALHPPRKPRVLHEEQRERDARLAQATRELIYEQAKDAEWRKRKAQADGVPKLAETGLPQLQAKLPTATLQSLRRKGQKAPPESPGLWTAQEQLWHWLRAQRAHAEKLGSIYAKHNDVLCGVLPITEFTNAVDYLEILIQSALPSTRCPACAAIPSGLDRLQCLCRGRGWLTVAEARAYKFTRAQEQLAQNQHDKRVHHALADQRVRGGRKKAVSPRVHRKSAPRQADREGRAVGEAVCDEAGSGATYDSG